MNSSTIALATSDSDIAQCFPVMVQLRPHLAQPDFVGRVRQMQSQGYQLASLTDDAGLVRAVAGFRQMDMLYSGKTLYIDDLVTDSASRSQGHGDRLFDWLVDWARNQ